MTRLTRAALVVLLSLGLGTGAAARTDELTSTSLFPPDNPLFLIQRLLDSWEEFLAFDEIDEARVQAKLARNRAAEAAAMLKAHKTDLAESLTNEGADRVAKAAAELAKAKQKAENARAHGDTADAAARQDAIERVLAQLTENSERQWAQLQSVLDQVENERAQQAIGDAMARWALRLADAGRAVNGERGPATPPSRPESPGRPESTGGPDTTQTGRPGATPAVPAVPARPTPAPARP